MHGVAYASEALDSICLLLFAQYVVPVGASCSHLQLVRGMRK